jgi:diguanylate cyclase (GGDEF)-like protein
LLCILLDIDYFKKFNDTYGHQTDDTVSSALGQVIKDSIRDSDFAARYGGEEFALVLYHADKALYKAKENGRNRIEYYGTEN